MDIRVVALDDPDAVKLIDEVQQEYVTRYGEPDVTPTDPAEFTPPAGLFLVGYLDDVPAVSGGWRVRQADGSELRDGDVEIKRMYVSASARRRGLARVMLAELERTAAAVGHRRMVLETGILQPEAIALYTASGYTEMNGFGHYAEDPLSRYFFKRLAG